jgi:hypothetical protein
MLLKTQGAGHAGFPAFQDVIEKQRVIHAFP